MILFSPGPERPPLYITYSSPSSTSILIHWGSVPPQFKNGIIRGFKVEYQEDQPGATGEVRERRLVNWALLGELKKFTIYSIRVRAFTSIGYGPENNITVLTAQDGMKAMFHVRLCFTRCVESFHRVFNDCVLCFHRPTELIIIIVDMLKVSLSK